MNKNFLKAEQKEKNSILQKIKINSKQINLINLIKKTNEEIEDYILKEEKENEYIIIPKKNNNLISSETYEDKNLNEIKEFIVEKINSSKYENKEVLKFLLEKINNKGFLNSSNLQLKNEINEVLNINLKIDEIEETKKILKSILPLGIGTENEIEYKKQQVQNLECKDILSELIEILSNGLSKQKYLKLEKKYGKEDLKKYLLIYLNLKSYPLENLRKKDLDERSSVEFFVKVNSNGELEPTVKKIELKPITVVSEKELKEKYSGEYLDYVLKKYNFAKELVKNLKKRNEYNETIIKLIVKKQRDFFLSGDINLLKPLVYEDISKESGISISTISRVVSNKKIQTDFGLFPLKNFFSRNISKTKNISIVQVCEKIKDIVSKNIFISDAKIREILKKENISVSRRTIANYRKKYNISNSYFREIIEDLKKNVFNK